MFYTNYVNPKRRDLLKQLCASGALITGLRSFNAIASDNQPPLSFPAAWRGDDSYDSLRRFSLWRANIPDRYPDLIATANKETEVREALAFARKNKLQLACRTSGHNTAGAPLRNGGMMLYINGMTRVQVNPDAGTATFQPGVNMAMLFAEARKHGLDFPTADCPTVAMSGYILGGGLGKNSNYLTQGPACNALLSAEVLLANGELVTVDKDHYPDIFWAMRGCGPAFFGIVLSMTVKLFDSPKSYLSSKYTYPVDELPSLLKLFDDKMPDFDPRVNVWLMITAKRNSNMDLSTKLSVSLTSVTYSGPDPQAEARSLLESYADAGLGETAQEKSEYVPLDLSGFIYAVDPGEFLVASTNDGSQVDNICTDDSAAMLAAVEHFKTIPAGMESSRLLFTHNTQSEAVSGADKDICYSAGGRHFMGLYLDWKDTDLTSTAYDWTRAFSEKMKPFAKTHYINQTDTGLFPDKIQKCFPDGKWERLQAIRKKYDPENRFFSHVAELGEARG